ncbi:MAG TPA: hypothetical protein VHG52_11475, partial [Thermomicrobiales bacterium]|nr:hypothetical protein [Thermomicrobiales bacterium]
ADLRELREAQVRYALDQLEPEERPIFVKSLQALVAGLTGAQGASSLAGSPCAPAAVGDRGSVESVSAADSASPSPLRESRTTKEPIHSRSLRGRN